MPASKQRKETSLAYKSRPTRKRRSPDDLEKLRDSLVSIVASNHPVTVRQVFYLAVAAGLIEKTEGEYKNTVCRLLTDLRREGRIPWHNITDFTRTMRKPASYDGLADLLENTAHFYRRDMWRNLDCRVEVWSEKETLTGSRWVRQDATASGLAKCAKQLERADNLDSSVVHKEGAECAGNCTQESFSRLVAVRRSSIWS